MENIRNFCIIAHIDHGKSTLADRFLELTHSLRKEEMREQFLDQMDLERERGITIKMQPCTMEYEQDGVKYQLNLIDTPGHMDFVYEVERSLAAVEGAILLVDATCGVQAQTLANLRLALKNNLVIIPAINKIDLGPTQEQLDIVKQEITGLLDIATDEILMISGKTGAGVEKVLREIVAKIPPPSQGQANDALKALVFDSFYDNYQGVVACCRVFQGAIKKDSKLFLINQKQDFLSREVGVFKPKRVAVDKLSAGEIGYIATGFKQVENIRIGDTITEFSQIDNVKALSGYETPEPLVFANFFPGDEEDFEILKTSIEKLRLNDNSLDVFPVNNPFLGRGLRLGFLGVLHLEITAERLKREYGVEAVITSPSVVFEVETKKGEAMQVHSAVELPDVSFLESIKEPWVSLEVITPSRYMSKIHTVVSSKRGLFEDSSILDQNSLLLKFRAPLSEIIEDFLDKIKSVSEGFASFSYTLLGYEKGDLVKLDFLIAYEIKPSLSRIIHRDKAQGFANEFLKKLKDNLPPKNFSQALQAAIGGKIIAREDIKALRKDVTAHLYGGDFTRRRKLLEKQKKGKKLMESQGVTNIPQEVYLKLIRR